MADTRTLQRRPIDERVIVFSDEHQAIVAEKDATIAKLREGKRSIVASEIWCTYE